MTSFSCNPNSSTGINSKGFETAVKLAKITCPANGPQNCMEPPSCCINNPQATFILNPKQIGFGSCISPSIAPTKIEKFLNNIPPLNTGLSSFTEKIVFFGIPFIFTIAIIICLIILGCLSIKDAVSYVN